MIIRWEVTSEDVARVTALIHAHENHPLVQDRRRRNVERQDLVLSTDVVWAEIVSCLVSTQQRWAAAEQFCQLSPFPLAYSSCIACNDVKEMAEKSLRASRLRRSTVVAVELSKNLSKLQSGFWQDLLGHLEDLRDPADSTRERSVADFVDDQLSGFGPKQARNLLQGLGLTRYEIPIDSRASKWLLSFGFPVPTPAEALGDQHYYHFVSDGVQNLCAECGVYPCMLDAAMFVSFEREVPAA
jgi:hypothetical protein